MRGYVAYRPTYSILEGSYQDRRKRPNLTPYMVIYFRALGWLPRGYKGMRPNRRAVFGTIGTGLYLYAHRTNSSDSNVG